MCHGSLSSTKWTGRTFLPLLERSLLITAINRPGANPERVIQQIRQKLRIAAAAVQVPIGVEDDFRGVVDLVRWKAIYNSGVKGCALSTHQRKLLIEATGMKLPKKK